MTRKVYSRPLAVALVLTLAGCSGTDGSAGPPGEPGQDATAYGTLTGTVSDTYGNLVAGATVSYVVGSEAATQATADASGAYSLTVPPGARTVTFAATGYTSYSQEVEVRPAGTATLDVTLNPTGRLAVTARRTDTATVLPGQQVTLAASAFVFDPALTGTTTFQWTVLSGPEPVFSSATVANPTVTLAPATAFKKALVELAAPRYTWNPDEPPINVDRYQVVPLSYEQVLSQANATKLRVTATRGGVSSSADVTVLAKLPAVPSTGLKNVPINSPVVLQGQFPFKKPDGAYVFTPKATWDWSVTRNGASVPVNDATTPYPDFVPTTAGEYVVSEGGAARFSVYAGTWQGVMTGPGTPDADCAGCHDGSPAADSFTPWKHSGHKEVIWAGIMEPLPDGHYTKTCTPCHTVGIGLTGAGGYADKIATENPDYHALQGSLIAEQRYWELYPASAKLAGIQCENCHGPHGAQHMDGDLPGVGNSRITYSSGPCATCHARAPRHGRYPQWLNSGHASYATFTYNSSAADGSLSAGCAACHSAQGFKAFAAALPTLNGNRSATPLPAGLTLRNAEPVSCPACHVSHDEGDLSVAEWDNLTKVGPVEGSTYLLPSGFAAARVGKGALCIACHNSRNGYSSSRATALLHEDGDPEYGGTIGRYTAPHEACQGDVLLGRNAYWMGEALYASPLTRSKHSYITDTCVTCHMELTTLDLTLSSEGQTRHDFKATPDVCNRCHTAYDAELIQGDFEEMFLDLREAVGQAILRLKYDDAIPAGTTARLVANRSGQVDVTVAGVTQRWFINDKAGQDAFLHDETGTLVAGCTTPVPNEEGLPASDCTGFLAAAPGVTSIGQTAGRDATVAADGVNEVIARALWNAVLVQDDASKGIHNPSFTFNVLGQTTQHVRTFQR